MSWHEFWVILVVCGICMLICRVLPMLLLKGRELPEGIVRALGLIPPAAFAALVANDLFAPGMFDAGLWPAAVPLVAASIEEFGWRQPIVVDADMTVVAGHTRLKAAISLGMETVPVVVADDLTPEQVKEAVEAAGFELANS